MGKLGDWSLVRSFLAVYRRGSLSAAARLTGQTQPTIGRHIAELEAELGIGLFTRSPSGLVATQAALALLPHAEAMEAGAAALVRAADTGGDAATMRGTVRITASEIMGIAVLPPMLADIRREHPALVFELALNNRMDDLLRRDADIAVRMTRPTQDGLVARKIGGLRLGFYAHRRYVEQFGLPASVETLPRAHLIGFDRDDHSARSVAEGILPISRDIFAFRCDNDAAQMAAIEAGLGIGAIQEPLARRNADLVPVLAGDVVLALDVWLVVHQDQRDLPPIRAVFDALATKLAAYVAS